MTTEQPDWHKSSYSAGAQNCVEVREHGHGADVRDSQHREYGHLSFPAPEWTAFIADLQNQRL